MTMIVTRAQGAAHLRIDDVDSEADHLDLLIMAASGVVLDYLEMETTDFPEDSNGDPEYPYQVRAATLLLLGDMHRYRDAGSPNFSEASLPASVRALLYPLKTFGLDSDYDDEST